MPGSWPESPAELEALQLRIAAAADAAAPWIPPAAPLIAAVFAATRRGLMGADEAGDPAWVAAVAEQRGRTVAWVLLRSRFPAGYRPGLLALREGQLLERAVRALSPPLERAVGALPPPIDVLLVNATGRDHPRRAGLAVHLGWALDVPTVGVTDRLLAGGEQATRAGPGRGVWVHPGWRTDPATALAVVGPLLDERTPRPLREARRLARTARSELGRPRRRNLGPPLVERPRPGSGR